MTKKFVEKKYTAANLNDSLYGFLSMRYANMSKKPIRTDLGVEFDYMKIHFDVGYSFDGNNFYFETQVILNKRINLKDFKDRLRKEKSDLLEGIIATFFQDEQKNLVLDVKRKITKIPLGKKRSLSGTLHKHVLKKFIGPFADYLRL